MLLEFRTKNYKAFADEVVFSMVPAPKQKGLDFSILSKKIGRKVHRALCSSVIYGPNASGKTNLIGAMEVFQSIILRGHIRNQDSKDKPNLAANKLELIPNTALTQSKPTEFSIKFIESNLLLEYRLSADLGTFIDSDYDRKVLAEALFVNEKPIFQRDADWLEIGDVRSIKEYWVNSFEESQAGATALAKNNLEDEELFLMNGFKTMFSAKLVSIITEWLEKKLNIVYRADVVESVRNIANPKEHTVYIEKQLGEALKIFGVTANELGLAVHDQDSEPTRVSVLEQPNALITAEVFESYGTIRFLNMFPFVLRALRRGGTLIVDEFDASIHPMALMSIINVFHNNELNQTGAQLIFDTHNPIFLNSNLFRRDEIKFVERDDKTHESTLYSLSDFGTSGKTGVRLHEDYMKNYFISQYGAIKDVDFSPVFEQLVNDRKEV